MKRHATILFLPLTFLACNTIRPEPLVVQQASFDHDCPREKIQIVERNDSIFAYRLNVCGNEKKYRDRGGDRIFQFVDVTNDPAAAPPPVK